jgi:hypothetical protein
MKIVPRHGLLDEQPLRGADCSGGGVVVTGSPPMAHVRDRAVLCRPVPYGTQSLKLGLGAAVMGLSPAIQN